MIEGYSIMIVVKQKPIGKEFIINLVDKINKKICSARHSGDFYNKGHIWISEKDGVNFNENNILDEIKNLPEIETAKLCPID